MLYLALNGFMHSLRRYFTPRVVIVDRWNWNRINATRLANDIRVPCVLIGFSDGASAGAFAANRNPWIDEVHLHSPLLWRTERQNTIRGNIYRTAGDKLPGAYRGAYDVFDFYKTDSEGKLNLLTLPPLPRVPIRGVPTAVMAWSDHQFHNCLRFLPQEIVSKDFRS